jgi:hypothetical protein
VDEGSSREQHVDQRPAERAIRAGDRHRDAAQRCVPMLERLRFGLCEIVGLCERSFNSMFEA